MLDSLATTTDAEAFGYTGVTDAALLQASTRVRAYVRQQVSLGSSDITARGPVVHLPERPVVSVDEVTDEDGNAASEGATAHDSSGWWLSGNVLTLPTSATYSLTYTHGFESIPDDVLEIVCTVAARVSGGFVNGDAGLGYDAWRGQMGLTAEEKAVLGRVFPRVPRTLTMRAL